MSYTLFLTFVQNIGTVLQLFKNNQLHTLLLVFLYALLFYTRQWLYPSDDLLLYRATSGWLAGTVYEWLGGYGWLQRLLFGVLLLLQAIYLNYLVQEYRLAKRPTYVTAIAYVLVVSFFRIENGLSPAFIANSFLLLSLGSLYRSYDKNGSAGAVFNAGFWLGVAALCYFSAAVLLLWAFLGLFILRSTEWRDWLILLLGFLMPFFWLGTYFFLQDGLGEWWARDIVGQLGFNGQIAMNPWSVAGLATSGLIFLWTLANWQGLHYKTTIREQKCIQVVFWMFLGLLLSFFAQNALFIHHLTLFAVPLAVLLSLNLQSIQSVGISELLHLLLLLGCLAVQYAV